MEIRRVLLCIRIVVAATAALVVSTPTKLAAQTLSKEYVRLNGQVIAIENVTTAAPAQATVSPTGLTFATQTVGTSSSTQTVTLSNPGGSALALSGIGLTGANASDFSATNNCGSSLAASSSCQINVTFTPQTAGSRLAALSISDNATGSPQTVPLSGTGTSSGGGGGSGSGGTPSVLTTYIGSPGAPVANYTSTPTITVPFRVYMPSGVSTFSWFEVNMNATSGVSNSFYILLEADGPNYDLMISGQLDGSGSAPYPAFQLTPNGQTVATNFSLRGLQVVSARLAVMGNELQLDLTLAQIGAAASYQVALEAHTTNGDYSQPWAATTVATWIPSNGPALSWSPNSFTYAGTNVGAVSASQTFTLNNSGSAAISISSIAMSGANPDDFSIRSNECPASLAAGASCPVVVAFTPSTAGARAGTLQVVNSAVGSPETVTLSGVGNGSELPPSVLTTYMGVWGDPTPAFNGSTVMLPLRVYCPEGASTFTYLQVLMNASSGVANSFYINLTTDGTKYYMAMSGQLDGSGSAPWPPFQFAANGQTVSTNFGLRALQVVSANLRWVGNELQLDLTLAQSGAISYQIALGAEDSYSYSAPWSQVTAGTWGN